MPAVVVDVRAHILANIDIRPDGCWLWKLSQTNGYGRFCAGGRNSYAHRVAYEEFSGPIPKGHQIDHLCRARACVNPKHLDAVTQTENIRRSDAPTIVNWRANVCKFGHSMSDAYPARRKGRTVGRVCRTCTKLKNAARCKRRYLDGGEPQ